MNTFRILIVFLLIFMQACNEKTAEFESSWDNSANRTWIGPEYWSNPLQDWQISDGMLECLVTGPNRTVHLLSYVPGNSAGTVEISVILNITPHALSAGSEGWAGFTVAAKGIFNDYRDDAVYGKGLPAGITAEGQLFIGEPEEDPADINSSLLTIIENNGKIELRVNLEKTSSGESIISLSANVPGSDETAGYVQRQFTSFDHQGNIALTAHFPGRMNDPDRIPSAGFSSWKVSGSGLDHFPERNWGPVLFTQYTFSKNIVKLTAQLPPLSDDDLREARLEIRNSENQWEQVATAGIDPMAFTATFRFEVTDTSGDLDYRVAYDWDENPENMIPYYYEGIIRNNPVDKEEVVVAAFTGNHDFGFPNQEVVDNVLKHQPDLLVFTGDQIYEPRGGFGYTIEPLEVATLDYLRKWYMVGWEYGEMLRNIPSVSLPDDHDVYHGNVWGAGGKAAKRSADNKQWQDDGGYKLPPEWVNMVQRTQTSHLPDPFDPAPALQDISVYYCDMNIGGISFAIIEDRKWKAAPKSVLPEYLNVINGWAENSRFNDPAAFDADVDLLGDRQIEFLDQWVGDWSHQTIMKSVISQTIFATLATLPDSAVSDVVVPRLRITSPAEYPENDIPTQDMDSNGWPRKGRDLAVKTMRKGFAFHIAGDQHLASTIKYGVDEWGDAGYAICVPSISNFFPRRWFPSEEGKNRESGQNRNLGDFTDGFGNKMTVLAVANPVVTGLEPSILYDRSTGYGIIRFNKKTREINIANWPRKSDLEKGGKPYPGWPIIISQFDNYSKEAYAWLPELEFKGTELPPVVKVINENTGELVYAVRAGDMQFSPRVFSDGLYTIETGEPGTVNWKVINGLKPSEAANEKLEIIFDQE